MPSTATITAFYSFSANTKARSNYVNNNFDIFRGHVIPVEPLTATSSNLNYDLGSSEYRWRSAYVRDIDLRSNTTTGNTLNISGDTTGSNGLAILFKINGTEAGRIGTGGFTGPNQGATTVAGLAQVAKSGDIPNIAGRVTTGATHVANSTLTVTTIGRPVHIMGANISLSTGTGGQLFSNDAQMLIWPIRNGVTLGGFEISIKSPPSSVNYYSPSAINFVDTSAPAGANVYSLCYRRLSGSTITSDARIGDMVLIGREL